MGGPWSYVLNKNVTVNVTIKIVNNFIFPNLFFGEYSKANDVYILGLQEVDMHDACTIKGTNVNKHEAFRKDLLAHQAPQFFPKVGLKSQTLNHFIFPTDSPLEFSNLHITNTNKKQFNIADFVNKTIEF